MANELNIVEETNKVDVIAKVISTSGQVGANIALGEIGSTGVYTGDFPATGAGRYTVKYEDSLGLIGSSEVQWNGTAELGFDNITVAVNVPSETINSAAGIPTVLSDIDGTRRSSDNVIRFLYDEQQMPVLYLLKDYLDSIDKLITDVTEVFFVIKTDATDTDLDALYSKTQADSEIVIDTSNSSISSLITSYSGLDVGGRYFVALGIKFAGDTQFREVPSTKKHIEFRQDVIRG